MFDNNSSTSTPPYSKPTCKMKWPTLIDSYPCKLSTYTKMCKGVVANPILFVQFTFTISLYL